MGYTTSDVGGSQVVGVNDEVGCAQHPHTSFSVFGQVLQPPLGRLAGGLNPVAQSRLIGVKDNVEDLQALAVKYGGDVVHIAAGQNCLWRDQMLAGVPDQFGSGGGH